jgi:hypothetical protein
MPTLPSSHVVRHLLTTATAMVLISGCATLSESQCVAGDWETVGYRDGLAGKQSARLLEHQNACVKHGVVPDRASYLAGWEAGTRQYCQPTNGFSVGESGRAFVSLCPDDLRDAYYAAYQEGRRLYLAKAEIESMNRQIAQKEHQLEQLAEELSSTEAELIAEETSTFDRVHLLDRTKELAARQGELDAEIQALQVDVALKRERLASLRQDLAYAY